MPHNTILTIGASLAVIGMVIGFVQGNFDAGFKWGLAGGGFWGLSILLAKLQGKKVFR